MAVSKPRVIIVGLERWPAERLRSAMRELLAYAADQHWYRLDDWPRALLSYYRTLEREMRRRGAQLALF